jgi:hypothetical protein
MAFEAWIADYTQYLKAHGYAARTLARRLKHLRAFERFVAQRPMKSLEEFRPQHVTPFLRYWVRHQPWAKTSPGLKRSSRFTPSHHTALQHVSAFSSAGLTPPAVCRTTLSPCERPCAALIASRTWPTTCAS